MADKKEEIKSEENKVWVTISHTVNLGNYESYKFDAGYSQTLLRDEDPIEKMDKMQEELRLFVLEKAQRVKSGMDAIDDLKMKKKRKF
jgi:hypothetical protein